MAKETKKQQKCIAKKMHKVKSEDRPAKQKIVITLRHCGIPKKKK